MPSYTVKYFPVKALGEGIRLLLSYGEVEFKDVRIAAEEWPQHKPCPTFVVPPGVNCKWCPSSIGRTPQFPSGTSETRTTMLYGQMPVLEIDGKQYAQSTAIYRMLGRKFGIAGADELEAFEIDQIMDLVTDLRTKGAVAFYEPDEAIKAAKYAILEKETFPYLLSKLDEVAKANNGHLALGKLTWADIAFAGMYDYLNRVLGFDSGEKYPNLKKVSDNVLALPAIKKFYETAPKTEF